MSLRSTLQAIEKTLPPCASLYREARSRHPVLAPYGTLESLIAVFRDRRVTAANQNALAAALVSEAQCDGAASFWMSLLLVIFEPMLGRLRSQVRWLRDADLDQEIFLAFIEAVRSVPVGPYTMRALWLTTRAQLFAVYRAAREERSSVSVVEDDEVFPADAPEEEPAERAQIQEVLDTVVDRVGGPELQAALRVMETTGVTLKEYVHATHPDATREMRESTYERLRRARRAVRSHLETTPAARTLRLRRRPPSSPSLLH